ncbi:MAG: hypothetical protein Q8K30_06500 [Candidatus Gracilibacteria bacterium]|nr:hypothetical protein [Candidatus Gracilibacteria bacterium]
MNKTDLYKLYLSKLEESLMSDDIDGVNYILEYLYTNNLPEDQMDAMDHVLHEATLYSELGENEYKEEALKIIEKFKG